MKSPLPSVVAATFLSRIASSEIQKIRCRETRHRLISCIACLLKPAFRAMFG
ncbi:hypothetical protein [Bradyrhizobium sp. WSM471]|uniref:hypothetical protein n=1 Tax=Bradyrhizobium sp. WSM471 TaxID=319017 RepID=UPI0002FD5AB8|nr:MULTISPECIES: hypothetical protein [Bradyrhizobium]UFW43482.1 hypothetical protein BcanWSM471_10570 [Bradyrhizobium canariense]